MHELLRRFIFIGSADMRLSPSHISLYAAILSMACENGGHNPVAVYSRQLMRRSKISGPATYHRCLKDLQASGYIEYEPSFDKYRCSLIYLRPLNPALVPV